MQTAPADSMSSALRHALNLLDRSWQTFTQDLGTTTLGFVTPLLVFGLIITVTLFLLFRKQGGAAVRGYVRAAVATAVVSVAAFGIVYGSIFVKSVVKTIYTDHQNLVSVNEALRTENARFKQPPLPPPTPSGPKLTILFRKRELDRGVIDVDGSNPFETPPIQVRNDGDKATLTPTISARLYFSEVVGNANPTLWQDTSSEESGYAAAFYWGAVAAISPGETWNIPPFISNGSVLAHQIRAKIKVFYGGNQPAEATFVVRPDARAKR